MCLGVLLGEWVVVFIRWLVGVWLAIWCMVVVPGRWLCAGDDGMRRSVYGVGRHGEELVLEEEEAFATRDAVPSEAGARIRHGVHPKMSSQVWDRLPVITELTKARSVTDDVSAGLPHAVCQAWFCR